MPSLGGMIECTIVLTLMSGIRLQVEYHSADFLKKYVDNTTTLLKGSPGCARVTREQCGASVAYPSLSLYTVSTLMHALRIMSFSALVDLSDSDLYTKNVSIYQAYGPFSLTTSRCAGSSLARFPASSSIRRQRHLCICLRFYPKPLGLWHFCNG